MAGRDEEQQPDQDKRASISQIEWWFRDDLSQSYTQKKHAMKATKNAEQSNNKKTPEKSKKKYQKRIKLSGT